MLKVVAAVRANNVIDIANVEQIAIIVWKYTGAAADKIILAPANGLYSLVAKISHHHP